jgi:hypothetical protein
MANSENTLSPTTVNAKSFLKQPLSGHPGNATAPG